MKKARELKKVSIKSAEVAPAPAPALADQSDRLSALENNMMRMMEMLQNLTIPVKSASAPAEKTILVSFVEKCLLGEDMILDLWKTTESVVKNALLAELLKKDLPFKIKVEKNVLTMLQNKLMKIIDRHAMI